MSDEKMLRRLRAAVTLYEAFGERLASLRMGALLFRAHPDLGCFLIETTSPNAPSDASEKLSDSSARVVSAEDQLLQMTIDTLMKLQRWVEEEAKS